MGQTGVAGTVPRTSVQSRAVTTSDEVLAQQAASGRIEAFEELVARYQDRVFNLLTRMAGSAEEAEDLAQETFLKAYRALGDFRQGSKFYTWLFRIAVNTGFSQRRTDVRRKKHEGGRLDAPGGAQGDDEQGTLGSVIPERDASDPAQQLDQALVRERVRQGLEEIDADYRQILVLRDIEGLDYDSIAETLDISRAAVKSRLHRARQELARILKDLKPS